MTPPLSIVLAISYAALTALFVGMFALLVGILVRALLPGHMASEWECLRPESEARGPAPRMPSADRRAFCLPSRAATFRGATKDFVPSAPRITP
jgi:hypothetical protein